MNEISFNSDSKHHQLIKKMLIDMSEQTICKEVGANIKRWVFHWVSGLRNIKGNLFPVENQTDSEFEESLTNWINIITNEFEIIVKNSDPEQYESKASEFIEQWFPYVV